MGRSRYKIYDEEYPYFITSSVVYGLPVFCMPEIAEIVLDALLFLQNQRGGKIYAYVIMENHIHLIVRSESLIQKISSFKSYTARRMVDVLKGRHQTIWLKKLREQKADFKTDRPYQVWQEGYHPKQIIGDDMMEQKIEYIHHNPVKRGYVDRPEDWRYSSARNYMDGSGLIPITRFKGRGSEN